jgi:thioredoxin-like negative regulator of GroEL
MDHVIITEHNDVLNDSLLIEFCGKQKIDGYPTLKLFYDGQFIELYQGGHSPDAIKKFIDEVVKKAESGGYNHAAAPKTSETAEINPNGQVVALSKDTFEKVS